LKRLLAAAAACLGLAWGLALIPGAAYASGTHYYFSTSGSDSNNCLTTSAPCATLAKASSLLLGPGDRVSLKRGDSWAHQGLLITGSGSAVDPIVVDWWGTATDPRPKITGGVQVSGKKGACIRVEGSYVNIDNIRTGSTSLGSGSCSDSTTFLYGYGVNALGSHVLIEHSSSEGNGAGYRLAGDYGRVTDSSIHDSQEYIDTPTAGDDSGTFGVLVNGQYAEVDHNTFYNNRDTSTDYGYDGSDVELFNASHANVHHNVDTGGSNGFSESGLSTGGTADSNVFEYNSFVSVGSTAGDAEAHGITLRGSGSSYGPDTNYVIRHNTIVVKYTGTGTDTTQGIGCSASCPSSTVITDNILDASFRALYDDNSGSTVTYNVLHGQVDTFTPDGTNFLTDPLLVSNTDLHPTASSPAVDAATSQPYSTDAGGATVPQDGNCNGTATADIGAWEYDSPNC
jgi:hypothetical protein